MQRPGVEYKHVVNVCGKLEDWINQQVDRKGDGEFVTYHETLGVVTEEFFELIEAVKSNRPQRIKEELKDIIVACTWGIASIDNQISRIPKRGVEDA